MLGAYSLPDLSFQYIFPGWVSYSLLLIVSFEEQGFFMKSCLALLPLIHRDFGIQSTQPSTNPKPSRSFPVVSSKTFFYYYYY